MDMYKKYFGELEEMIDHLFDGSGEEVFAEPYYHISITSENATININTDDEDDAEDIVRLMTKYGKVVTLWKTEEEE